MSLYAWLSVFALQIATLCLNFYVGSMGNACVTSIGIGISVAAILRHLYLGDS